MHNSKNENSLVTTQRKVTRMRIFKIFAFLLLVAPPLAQGAGNYDKANQWGVGLGFGKSSLENSDSFQNAYNGGNVGSLWLRYHLTSAWNLELDYTQGRLYGENASITDMKNQGLFLNMGYRFFSQSRFRVLTQLGFGANRLDPRGEGDNLEDFGVKATIGAEFMATSSLALALHGTYNYMNVGSGTDSELHSLTPMLALTYYFGGGSPAAAAAEIQDSDGDGVANDQDQCPDAGGTNVDAKGCPVAAVTLTDADGDGIEDAKDRCPDTGSDKKVNAWGCEASEKLEFSLNVQFRTGSTTLDPKYLSGLKDLGAFLKKNPGVKAEIAGYTDNTGSVATNTAISKKRADAVVDYLVNTEKVEKGRLTAVGYGPENPVADNATAAGRKTNRRVEAKIKN